MTKENRVQLITPLIRMSFPKLSTPRKYKEKGVEKGEAKYSLQMVIAAEDMGKFKQEVDGKFINVNIDELYKTMAKTQWPDLSLAEAFPKKPTGGTDWPIKNGNKMIAENAKLAKPKKLDFMAGHFQISVSGSEKIPPRLSYVDPDTKDRVILDRENPEDMKIIKKLFDVGGNYAICEISLVAHTYNGKCYLTAYLNHVMFKKVGERLGGQSMMDRFEGVDGGEGEYTADAEEDDYGV